MTLRRALSTVGALTGISRIAGFCRDVLTAALLGAGAEADAFFIALRLPDLMRRLFAEGAFSAAFAPQFADALSREGREAALRFAGQTFTALLAAAVVVVVLGWVGMPLLVGLLAPGFDDGAAGETAVSFARLTFPYLIPVALAALFGAVLNGLGRVAAFAASPIVFNAGMLAALGAAALTVGVNGAATGRAAEAGLILSAGVALSGCLQLAWMWAAARRGGVGLRLAPLRFTALRSSPRLRALTRGLGPGALIVGVGQINLTVDMMLASLLPAGAVAALGYADRLAQLPMGIVGLALGMALLPRLAGFSAAGDRGGFAADLRQGAVAALALGVPAAVGLAVAAQPIIETLFVRGAFTADDAHLTAAALAGYAVGIPAAVTAKAQAAAYFARNDMRTPLRAAAASAAANLVFSLALAPAAGAAGLALATSLAAFVNAGMLWRGLGGLAGDPAFTRGLLRPTLAVAVAGGAMGWIAWTVAAAVPPGAPGLAGIVGAGAASYAVLLLCAVRLGAFKGL